MDTAKGCALLDQAWPWLTSSTLRWLPINATDHSSGGIKLTKPADLITAFSNAAITG